MLDYQILAGPDSQDMRRSWTRCFCSPAFADDAFRPAGRGGHVILSFSAVHVRG